MIKYMTQTGYACCRNVTMRIHLLYIFNELLAWGGSDPPTDLTASIRSSSLSMLRAALYAPDSKGMIVYDLVDLWDKNAYFDEMVFTGLRAGTAALAKHY